MSETNDHYLGPEVNRSRDRDKMLARRVALVDRLARRNHANEILLRATSDEGAYPSRVDAIRGASWEVETLMRGLGRWSAADPGLWDTVWEEAGQRPTLWPKRRRNPWASRDDLWHPDD